VSCLRSESVVTAHTATGWSSDVSPNDERHRTYDRTFDEDESTADGGRTTSSCPECHGQVITNVAETVCTDCGLIVADQQVDHGPEWRVVNEPGPVQRRDPGAMAGTLRRESARAVRHGGAFDETEQATRTGNAETVAYLAGPGIVPRHSPLGAVARDVGRRYNGGGSGATQVDSADGPEATTDLSVKRAKLDRGRTRPPPASEEPVTCSTAPVDETDADDPTADGG
jgi:hypothetical protein